MTTSKMYEIPYHDAVVFLRQAKAALTSASVAAKQQSNADSAFEWNLVFRRMREHIDAALKEAEDSGDPLTLQFGEGNLPDKSTVSIVVIVQGEALPLDVQLDYSLRTAMLVALKQSSNTIQSAEAWELRDIDGARIEDSILYAPINVPDGTRFLLTPKVGAGA